MGSVSSSQTNLAPRRQLIRAVHRPVLNVRNAAINQHVAVTIGHPERVRAWPHSRVGLHEVVVRSARYANPLTARREVFQLGNRIAMVAYLHGRPPLVAAVFEVVRDWTAQGRADHLPGDGHTPLRQIGDLTEGLLAQVEVTGLTFWTQINDAHGDGT